MVFSLKRQLQLEGSAKPLTPRTRERRFIRQVITGVHDNSWKLNKDTRDSTKAGPKAVLSTYEDEGMKLEVGSWNKRTLRLHNGINTSRLWHSGVLTYFQT